MGEILFYLVGAGCVAAAVLSVTAREVVHSIIYLAGLFVGIGLVYLILGIPFLAAIQVLVYVGGVIAMMLFAMMLVRDESAGEMPAVRKLTYGMPAVALLLVLLVLLGGTSTSRGTPVEFSTLAISDSLFKEYLLPFEVLGVLLTAAVVGAIVIAMRNHPEAKG